MPETPATRQLPDLLAQVHREIHTDLSRILADNGGLPVEQWRILSILAERDGLSMGELSDQAFMAISALSKTIDRMVFRALVHRRQDNADQRRVLIHITSFGHEMLRSRAPAVERFCDDLTASLGPDDSHRLESLLRAILAARGN
ncbi:MAG: MarR family transcriptional regulator [Mesorhizobium sp.]